MIAQLKEVNTDGRNSSFISSAADYQLQAKKYIRRIRTMLSILILKETGAGPCNRMDGCGFLSGVVEKL